MSAIIIGLALSYFAVADGPVRDVQPSLDLPTARSTTRSIGHPYYGRLKDGVALPAEGAYHRVQRSTVRRRWVYGTGYLVRGLVRAARDVAAAAPGGTRLVIGNLSRKGGGDIKMSMSHNTGRDVDLAYFTMDADGRPVDSSYHKFGPDGHSRSAGGKYRLDVARNWTLVRALMTNDEFELQWLITAPYIEEMLLAHARSIGEAEDIVQRAERMMMLPGWAKLHDNHFHIRVLCSPEDWAHGCSNAGPVWPWATAMSGALDAASRSLSSELRAHSADRRQAALNSLVQRDVQTAIPNVAPLLSDEDEKVRDGALKACIELASEANASTLLKVARWLPGEQALDLLHKALPLCGAEGVATAKALVAGTHPVASDEPEPKKFDKVLKSARKLIERFAPGAAHRPGGPR